MHVYVIPPYLLHTCIGEDLHREIVQIDSELAEQNAFPADSTKYRFRTSKDVAQLKNTIRGSGNEKLNEAILQRLEERLAALGVLGRTPSENYSREYLYEMYETFRIPLDKEAKLICYSALSGSGLNSFEGSDSKNASGNSSTSIYKQKHLGEFFFDSKKPLSYESFSLVDLLAIVRMNYEHKYSFFPFLTINGTKSFLSPLPMYWTSLSVDARYKILLDRLNMSVDIEDGYSIIKLKGQNLDEPSWPRDTQDRSYYNFIADKEVKERTSIYYYEVTVHQRANKASLYTNIIQTNDESVSSGSCILFSVGFTKRFTKYWMSNNKLDAKLALTVDLKQTQRDMLRCNDDPFYPALDPALVRMLQGEPGVLLDGSVAVSFNNSCSFAPNKDDRELGINVSWDRLMRLRARRNSLDREVSNLGIDIHISTSTVVMPNSDKHSTSDVVGFGVNFIDNSLFITVNGILVEVIEENDMKSGNSFKDSIFARGTEPVSLYPIIGLQLSHMPFLATAGEKTAETLIITNFGHREFKFDIENYVQSFKAAHTTDFQKLFSSSTDSGAQSKLPAGKAEKFVHPGEEDHVFLQNVIMDYLSNKGYFNTYREYHEDLSDLDQRISRSSGRSLSRSAPPLQQPHIERRHVLQNLILAEQYEQALSLLVLEYAGLPGLSTYLYELRLLDFLKTVLRKFEAKSVDTEELSISDVYSQGRKLLADPETPLVVHNSLISLLGELCDGKEGPKLALGDKNLILSTRLDDSAKLAHYLKDRILEFELMEKKSELEKIISATRKNISKLSDLGEKLFRLVNFDKEYLS